MPLRPIVLVAASGLAKEVLATIAAAGVHRPIAVLDDNVALKGTALSGIEIAGGISEITQFPDAEIVICAGSGRARSGIAARLSDSGVEAGRFARIIHPSVDVPAGCAVGAGSVLLAGVVITAEVTVGEHVVAMPNVVITHDCVVSAFATLCAGVALGGGVVVEECAYLGMNSSVRQGVAVGAGSVLGMGAVLLKDLPAGQTWAGVPAGPINAGPINNGDGMEKS